jgi:receptor protein-tyrosine kinase
MSKIYEVLRRGRGELSEALLPLLSDEQSQPDRGVLPEVSREEVIGVLEDSETIAVPSPPESVAANGLKTGRTLALRLPGSAPLLPFDNTNFAAAEQYRIIRTRLIQHPKQPRMILISSAGPGDGKSVTAVNIAGALSLKTEGSVLLLDADLRRSTIHSQLGLPISPGLSDLLRGAASLEQALIQTEQFQNLYVISAGQSYDNPSELLDSTRWGELCSEFRQRFRYVIADSPPVASVADYDLLQAACDGVVVIVRPDHTKRQACLKALELVPKERLIGVIMNCVSSWILGNNDLYTSYYHCKPTTAK